MSEHYVEVRWDHLLPKEFALRVEDCPVCYMPVGTLERHGSHMAFGLDAMKAHGLCVRAATKYGGIVLPPLHWGTHGTVFQEDYRRETPTEERPTAKMPPGSVYISEGLLMNLLMEMFREVEYSGFNVIVCLTGHYPDVQVDCVKNAAAQYMSNRPIKIWGLCEPETTGEVEVGHDHAGKWETSLFMELYPELVDMERCPDPETGKFMWTRPAALEASPELGQKTVEWIADQLGQGASKVLKEFEEGKS